MPLFIYPDIPTIIISLKGDSIICSPDSKPLKPITVIVFQDRSCIEFVIFYEFCRYNIMQVAIYLLFFNATKINLFENI